MTYLDMAMTLSSRIRSGRYERDRGEARRLPVRACRGRGRSAGCSRSSGWASSRALSDVFARHAADELFSEIDEVGVRDGANLVVEGYDFAPTFSIWTTIEECLNPPVVWERDRGWFTTAPFSEPEVFDFPEGIGPVECVNVEHEEVLLVPRWVDCRRVTFKYGLGDEFIEVLKTLHKLGLDRKEPIRVGGVEVAPRDVVAASAPRPGDARRADDGQDLRRDARDGHGQGRRAAADLPLPRRRQRVVDARVRLARRSSGRPRSTRSSPWSCSPAGAWSGTGVLGPGGVPGGAVPRQARRLRRAARGARARAVGCGPCVLADDLVPASSRPLRESVPWDGPRMRWRR